jgi:hypothetical protein
MQAIAKLGHLIAIYSEAICLIDDSALDINAD